MCTGSTFRIRVVPKNSTFFLSLRSLHSIPNATSHLHTVIVASASYVPNTAGGSRLPYKMRWLAALREAMHRERAKHKVTTCCSPVSAQRPNPSKPTQADHLPHSN